MSAGEVAVNLRLSFENMRALRRCGALAGVDAAQCYDRIVHSLSSLLFQNEGSLLSTVLLMFGAIQSMEFFLRTTFDDSTHMVANRVSRFRGLVRVMVPVQRCD